MSIQKVDLSGYSYGKHECLNEDCGSSDAMQFYSEEDGAYCFSCQTTFLHNEDSTEIVKKEKKVSNKELKIISKEESARIKSEYTTKGNGYRGVRDEIYEKFAFRHKYDEDGKLIEQLVPVTYNSEIAGYKRRKMPKDFSSPIGETGSECELVNQYFFRNHTGTLVIVGGEIKALAAYQMFFDDNKSKGGKWDEIAVVSPTIGETGAHKQIKKNYNFINQFKKIYVCMDSDKAGEEAAESILKILPAGKSYKMKMRLKDADDYIKAGREKDFISDFFNSKLYIDSSITPSNATYDEAVEFVGSGRYSLPPFMKELQEMLRGGLPTQGIVNLGAGSGTGKSTIVNAFTLHQLMINKVPTAIAPFENSNGEYLVDLLSTLTGTKIQYLETAEERIKFLELESTKEKFKKLSEDENGMPRFYLLDCDLNEDELKERIIELIVAFGIKMIVLDPVSDLFDMIGSEKVPAFMSWLKTTYKKYGVLFVLITHMRKNASGEKAASQGGLSSEEGFMGSSTIYKSGHVNIIIGRNKEAEEEIERNTTVIKVTKARGVGNTGMAGSWYYDKVSHRLYDLNDYMSGLDYSDYYKLFE